MWNRVQLKSSAKQVLNNNLFGTKWLMSALVTFINTTIVGAIAGIVCVPIIISMYGGILAMSFGSFAYDEFDMMMLLGSFGFMALMFIMIMVVAFVINVFVTAPLDIGLKRYFLALRDPYDNDAPNISIIFSCFKKGEYMKAVKTWGVALLQIQLWTLIPYAGAIITIIKTYEYFYVPYIVADNPDIDRKYAMVISSQMTSGEKWQIFVLQLSFLGWELLASLIYVGVYWVLPYENTTYANLYDFAKKRAIGTGVYPPQSFGINPEGDPDDPFRTPLDLSAFYIRNRQYSRGYNR